jgi:ABC-type bacteriocin/lantibiotic exporter with double-glycine peptidase domain
MFNLIENCKHFNNFIKYLLNNFIIFRYLIVGVIFLSIFEYVALSISLLLVEGSNLNETSAFVSSFWKNIFYLLGIDFDKKEILWIFIILLTSRIFLGYAFSNLSIFFSKKIHFFFNQKIFNEIINNISLLKIYKKTVGHYLQLAGDSSFKSGAITVSFLDLIVASISGIVSLYILFQFSQTIFLSTVVFLFFCIFVYFFLIILLLKINLNSIESSKLAGTLFLDSINNLRSIRTIKGEDYIVKRHESLMKNYTRLLFRLEFLKKTLKVVPVIVLLLFAIYYFSPTNSVNSYSTDIVYIFTTIVILSRVLSAFGVILISFIDFLTQFQFVKDINNLINIFNKNNLTIKKPVPKNNFSISNINLSNLNFSFDKNKKIINNFNYKFVKNNIYAILGKSGTGKSTLADIISGLITKFDGNLYFNKNRKLKNLFSDIILVEQDSKIFTGTVYDNLSFGKNFKKEDVKKILIYFGLEKFADNLHLKLNYRGSNISGGEKQRFAIVRALLRNPSVLILDEATNALDEKTFSIVMKKLKILMKNKILILITHESRVKNYVNKIIEFK